MMRLFRRNTPKPDPLPLAAGARIVLQTDSGPRAFVVASVHCDLRDDRIDVHLQDEASHTRVRSIW